jgi:uncharacterized RDD family membrane protein YckC
MQTDFTSVMSGRTDEELIRIVTVERGGYQPQAIEAAEAEIAGRNIAPERFAAITAAATHQHEEQQAFEQQKATTENRVVNMLIDTVAVYILMALMAFVYGYLTVQTGAAFSIVSFYIVLAAVFFGYYVLMELTWQQTIGKFATKTKVVDLTGGKPGFNAIVIRTCCRLIPFEAFTFLLTDNGFHDRLSDTTVIRDKK